MSGRVWLTAVAVIALIGVTYALAQNRQGRKADSGRSSATAVSTDGSSTTRGRPAARKRPMALTPARKAAAMTFAKLYHPELAGLLVGLEKHNRLAYRRAVRQLYQTSERLARMKERLSPERFDLELRAWRLDSRIRLLAARVYLSKRKNPKREAELSEALLERVEVRLERLRRDRNRTQSRLIKINASIHAVEADRQKAANQFLKRVKRGLGLKKKPNRSRVKRRGKKDKKNNRSRVGKNGPKPSGRD